MRICVLLALCLCAGAFAAEDHKIIIAHRGASGYLPEHTLEAYSLAYGMGADYIEPDVVLTKDGHFVVLHDINLEDTTNVEEMFPDRKRPDGKWYAIDLTLAEIKQLDASERLPKRFPQGKAAFKVPTLEEMIELVQGLNQTTGRNVGIYPELKAPSFHEKEGQPMEQKLLDLLKQYGYEGPDAKCYVQCFEEAPLKKMRELGSTLPQIYLVENSRDITEKLSEANLAAIAAFATGIGPDKTAVELHPEIVQHAHAARLLVHPYTVRKDQKPGKYPTTRDEIRDILFTIGADGLFCDFPDDGVAVAREGVK